MAVLTEEQEMLRDMARDRTSNESLGAEWRKVRGGGDPKAYDETVHAIIAEMGWTGIIIFEEHGGSDFNWLSAGLVISEWARRSPLATCRKHYCRQCDYLGRK